MYFVNEIFTSLQGEGYWTGTPMVFLRFAGCNLRCPFCDTAHTSPSTPMSLDELLKAVAEISPLTPFGRNDNVVSTSVISSGVEKSPIRRICITGGEPGLQVDAALIDALHEAGFTIHIETNGTCPLPPGIDWVTLSPKSDFVEGAGPVILGADELKLVFTGDATPERWLSFPAEHHFLQPCYDAVSGTSNVGETVSYILSHPSWRLSLQTHRILGLR